MPMYPPELPDAIDPDDPAEQGFRGERDQPRAQSDEREPSRSRQPIMPLWDDDDRHSER